MGSLEILKKNIAEADMVLVGIGNENRDNGQRQKYEKLLENKNHYIIDEDMTEASEGWNLYSKWLMGTLNRKLCLIESDVSMNRPDRIRWPFEKIAEINNKAVFIRINEKLPFLPVELKDKGISIKENAIDILKVI